MELSHEGEVRCICHPKMNGALNMAVDEILSRTVVQGPPVIRFYGFSPATLSIGRFQKTEGQIRFDRLENDGTDFVRRPTGGQAVLHDNELTYSVILSREHLFPFHKRQVYRFVSSLLIETLKSLGIEASFSSDRIGDHRHPDCFATTGEYEIITASGRKLIGSAQTTSRISSLQHGSIPLGVSSHTAAGYLLESTAGKPAATLPPATIEEELGRPVGFEEAVRLFRKAFGKRLHLADSELSEEERLLSSELAESKYRSRGWNLQR